MMRLQIAKCKLTPFASQVRQKALFFAEFAKGDSMRLFAALITALFLNTPAAYAQESLSGPVVFEGGNSTGACTLIGGDRPNSYCLHLGCDAGGAPYFALLSGAPPVTGDVTLAMRENSESLPILHFSTDNAYDGDAYIWVAPYDPARDRAILRALDRGAMLDILLVGPGGHDSWRANLADARGGVAGVLAACGAPGVAAGPRAKTTRPQQAPASMPSEAARVLDTLRDECADFGGTLTTTPDFLQRPDLNGDGRTDLVVNYGAAMCSAAPSFHCGSGGCDHEGFLTRPDGSLRHLFFGLIQGYEPKIPGVLTFHLHGSSCGLVGAAPCQKDYAITDDGLKPIE